MADLIERQAAIDALMTILDKPNHAEFLYTDEICKVLNDLPSAQPEQPTEVQDILQYLDEYLHPIVSPEHWSVYSELYDMVSMLLSAQPDLQPTCNKLATDCISRQAAIDALGVVPPVSDTWTDEFEIGRYQQ